MWSPFHLPESEGNLGDEVPHDERPVYTHEEYINLVIRSGQVMSHDYSHQSTEEDPRMMAFFDSLVQRELEGWSSEESVETNSDFFERFVQPSQSDESGTDHAHTEGEEGGLSPFTIAFASAMASRSRDEDSDNIELDDPHSDHDDESDRHMPGQRNNPGRRSISDLITLRRKEYLASLKKSELDAKKKKKARKQLRMALVRKRQRNAERSSTDSSSDIGASATADDSTTALRPKRKRVRIIAKFSSDSSSPSEEEKKEIPELLKQVTLKKGNRQLERLRRMRSRVMQSDTDSSDNENCKGSHKKSTDSDNKNGSISEPLPSTSGAFCCKIVEEKNGQSSEAEIGPHLSEAVVLNEDSKSSCGSRHEAANGITEGPHLTDSQTSASGFDSNTKRDGANNTDPKGRHSNNSHNNTASNSANNNNSASNKMDVNQTQPGETTWTEFKRFKSRVERARRQYRRCSQQDSSGEET